MISKMNTEKSGEVKNLTFKMEKVLTEQRKLRRVAPKVTSMSCSTEKL